MATNTAWNVIEKLHDLFKAKFTEAKIYKANLMTIPHFPDAGTYCLEVLGGPTPLGETTVDYHDQYRFNIWIFKEYLDRESGQEEMTQIVENTVAFLREDAQVTVEGYWWSAKVLDVEYGKFATERTTTFLRASRIEWACEVMHDRTQ